VGAEWNNVSQITQTWNGSTWAPSTAGTYNTSSSSSECRFKCKTNYERKSNSCVGIPTGPTYAGDENTITDVNGVVYTMKNKNMEAGSVWYTTDSWSWISSYGSHYQWGNNYGFPGTQTTPSTSSTKVSAAGKGPTNNYYSNSTFILLTQRDSSNNTNLW
jgi:hypothetical protein